MRAPAEVDTGRTCGSDNPWLLGYDNLVQLLFGGVLVCSYGRIERSSLVILAQSSGALHLTEIIGGVVS